MMMTKALQFVEDPDKTMTYKVLLSRRIIEFVTIEVSGGPIEQDRPYTLGDTKKTLLKGGEMLQDTLQQYLDASLETVKKLKFYIMQII
ncbi:6101_t:CDS:1, partial [Funneliformis caledonium]